MTSTKNIRRRRSIVTTAVTNGISELDAIRKRIEDEGVPMPTDDWIANFVAKSIENQRRESLPKVYCDAAWSRSKAGIGVISHDLGIEVSEEIESATVNVAECRAVVRAIEEVRQKEGEGLRFFSDSLLVVNWTKGTFACRSATAVEYVPKIRQLLDEVEGTLEWISGRKNPADKLSREAVGEIIDDSLSPLELVQRMSMKSLRFRHFAALKCGRDQFSSFRLPKLKEVVPVTDVEAVVAEFNDDEKRQASCLRWVLRGLPLEKAIRKVKTDIEITQNAVVAKRKGRSGGNE